MKKILSIFLVICMLVTAMSVFTIGTGAYTSGDLNNDGKINAIDASMMCAVIVGGESTNLALKMADIDGDNKVNSTDDNLMKLYFVGKYELGGTQYKIGTIVIAGRDITEYVIECPDGADDCMNYAASTLRSHIGDACGIYPDVVTNAGDRYAFRLVKDPTATDMAGELGDEAYHMYTTDNGVTIVGGRYSGCMHAVYDFLSDYLGYRYYYKPDYSVYTKRDQAFRYIYEADVIEIESFDVTHYPAIQSRNTYGSLSRNSPALHYNGEQTYNNRNYGTFGIGNKACHGIQNEGYITEAEMNLQDRGYTYGKQPCYTNKNNLNQTIERVLARLDNCVAGGLVPGYTLNNVDVSQIDCTTFCFCRTCVAVIREDIYNAGPVLRFTNAVEEAIQARPEYRDKIYVGMLAYAGTSVPPAVTRPNKMVMISYCFYVESGLILCTNCSIGDKTCPTNKIFAENFEKWSEFTDNIYIWYYPMDAYYYGGTSIYLFNVYEDFKYLAEHHVYGVFTCGEDRNFDSAAINYILMQHLMWNIDMTYEEYLDLVKETIFLMYGDGYQQMYDYLEILQTASKTAPGNDKTEDGKGHYCAFHSAPMKKLNMTYLKENADKIISLREEALSYYTKGTTEYTMVETFFMSAVYLVCCATHTSRWLNGTTEQREWYKTNLDYFVKYSKELGIPISSYVDGFTLYYIEPDKEIDYDENPLMWTQESLDPNGENFGGTFGGWDNVFNY